MLDQLKGIGDYLSYIQDRCRVEIVVDDFSGKLRSDLPFLEGLKNHLVHQNPFCMQVKSEQCLWDVCVSRKTGLMLGCTRKKAPFYGMCHCGREEFIIPIIHRNTAVASISAGGFSKKDYLSRRRIKQTAQTFSLPAGPLYKAYEQSLSADQPDLQELEANLAIAAIALELYYHNYAIRNSNFANTPAGSDRQITCHAVSYIGQNYHTNFSVKDVADYCHCSVSTLSHIFTGTTGYTIRAYRNKFRMDEACCLLAGTAYSIGEIAWSLGFEDSNYFSRVFTKACGMPPRQYRSNITGPDGPAHQDRESP